MKKLKIIVVCCLIITFMIGCSNIQSSVEIESIIKETEVETEAQTEREIEESETETLRENFVISEETYKLICDEVWYDEVFFGDEDLKGEYVKLHLMFSEKYFFTDEDMSYNDTVIELKEKYNIYRDFYKCCVLRKDTNSYLGQSIQVFFSQDTQLNPSDYQTGQKVVMYGEIIHYNNNTLDGYNTVYFIPKYIEMEE